MNSKEKGRKGEEIALHFLLDKKNYRLVQRNYTVCGGEIDIIMLDADVLVFVEVKLRTNKQFGCAQEAISSEKCRRLRSAASKYLNSSNWMGACRFDVIAIQNGVIEHLVNAF